MPTIVETHKTFDKKNFFKSGDIGQALLVFLSEKDRDIARSKNMKTLAGEYYAHGLTSASYDIVNKRFLKTQQNSKIIEDTSFIKEVMEDIGVGWEAAENGKEIREFVDEEVVDFEDWMATPDEPYGISIKLKGKDIWNKTEAKVILDHPDILALPVEEEEKKEKEKVKVKQTLASSSSMSSLNIKNQAMEIEDDGNIDIEFNDHDDDGDEKEVDEDEIEKDDNDNAADDDEDDDDDENAWMDDI
jgi:TATA-binding protein-associated factor Taf7